MNFRTNNRPRRIVRDFHRPRYGNPMFPRSGNRRQQRTGPSYRPWMAYVSVFAVLAGAMWYVFWSSAFRVSAIEVVGVSRPAEEAIRAGLDQHMKGSVLFVFPRANLLVFDRDAALEDIRSKVVLENITLRKRLPNALVVEASEKVARAALDWKDRLYALDESGAIIRELSEEEIGMLGELPPRMDAVPVAGLGAESVTLDGAAAAAADAKEKDEAAAKEGGVPLIMVGDIDGPGKENADATPGDTAVPTTAMKLILQAHARLPDIAGSPVRWYIVRASSETVEAVMEGEWRVLMSSAIPFDAQGERLSLVLKEKIGARKAQLEYVDLRYNERIFFRMKGETAP